MKKYSMLLLVFAVYALPAFAQDNLNTTRIGVWPYSWGNTLAIHEDHLFLSYGRVIQVYEYANPQQPELKGEIFVDDRINVLAFADGKAYAAGYAGFFILDVSNPEQPEIISHLDIPGFAYGVSLYANFVYLAMYDNYFGIIDISDANNPVMVAVHQMEHQMNDVVMLDGLAWIAAGTSGVMAYDLGDPTTPELVYHYSTSGNMRSLAIVDDLLYAFNKDQGLMIFDIAKLPAFNLLSTTYIYGWGTVINIENDVIAVTLSWIGFALYDISNPSAPDSLGTFYADVPNRQVILKDGYAYHCHGPAFNIIDITAPSEMTLLSSIGLSSPAKNANYWDNHLYVSAPAETIMVLDITDPLNVVKVSEIEKSETSYEIYVKDDLLFNSHYYDIMVYDVTQPSDPIFLNSFNTAATPDNILKHNNLLFVGHSNNLEVFDISDIMFPHLLGVYPYGWINEMIAEGNLLYLASTLSVIVLDISDPFNISQLSSIQNYGSTSLDLKGSMLYVVSSVHYTISEKSLNVFDVSDPTSIFRVKSMELSREFNNVFIEGDYLYVYERSIGLQIYDIQQLTPVHCGFYSNRLLESKTPFVNGLIYVPVIAGIDIVQNDLLTSVENIFIEREDRLNLFPNPAGDFISFMLEDPYNSGTFSYEIIQMNGTGIKSGNLTAGQQQISLDGLPSGVYVLHLLQSGEKSKSGLFIIQ
ncbi:MAG: T9SS type A sorting domain-containing protein [Bacteroidales bacterium]|nr:T9SS type A sorting domain-containing protein [Bacteroidales bacterium]